MVAECSGSQVSELMPLFGVAFEISFANNLGKPIQVIHRPLKEGTSNWSDPLGDAKVYRILDEAREILNQFLDKHRLA